MNTLHSARRRDGLDGNPVTASLTDSQPPRPLDRQTDIHALTKGEAPTGIDPKNLLEQPELERRLQVLLDQSRAEPLRATLALLQLKNFYEIRTWVGKAEASLLLADITRVLCKTLPPTVTLSHCDNYEFALLLSNECSSNASEITRRVQAALQSAASSTIPQQLQLQCAVGLARLDAGVHSAEVLFARARHSLSHTVEGSQAAGPDTLDNKAIARMIPDALRQQQLELRYQALLHFKHPTRVCYEVRSSLCTRGSVIAGQKLYEAAVWNALGELLDRAVILKSRAALAHKQWQDVQLIVNLSQNSLVSNKFTSWLAAKLRDHPQLHHRLFLQISELDLLGAQHHLSSFSESLRELGVPLCITHFGSTRDPMRYLHLLHVHMVKLHPGLLGRLKAESLQLDAVRALIEQLHNKGIRVAAGMLDNPAQLPLLWQIGIDAIQGNCIASSSTRPLFPALEQRSLDPTPHSLHYTPE
jgi:EAL domain-containing protein (putative c-di-GMP-specific phosphodiesterase class I)